jgi:hypothetical protein
MITIAIFELRTVIDGNYRKSPLMNSPDTQSCSHYLLIVVQLLHGHVESLKQNIRTKARGCKRRNETDTIQSVLKIINESKEFKNPYTVFLSLIQVKLRTQIPLLAENGHFLFHSFEKRYIFLVLKNTHKNFEENMMMHVGDEHSHHRSVIKSLVRRGD